MASASMYHPVYNPEGCGKAADDLLWYNTAQSFTSKADCFNQAKLLDGSGYIASGKSGRPDGKYADAIYASDVKDLRMSSRRRPLKEIREEAKRKAIAGEIRGFAGVPFTYASTTETLVSAPFNATSKGRSVRVYRTSLLVEDLDLTNLINEIAEIEAGFVVSGVLYKAIGVFTGNGINVYFVFTKSVATPPIGDGASVDALVFSAYKTTRLHSQANPTWTDIIGDPARIAATFPDGVEGQWIPVIPNGTSNTFKFNRKVITAISHEYDSDVDSGINFTNGGVFPYDSVPNSRTFGAQTTQVALYHYETQAHFTQDANNGVVADLGNVYCNQFYAPQRGAMLCSSLIGKVPTGLRDTDGYAVEQYTFNELGILANSTDNKPTHNTLLLNAVIKSSPTVKVLNALTSVNGVANVQLSYKEMVYDTSFGDNNQFEITDNQSTLTDGNGNTVLYGTASFPTQYFIDESN